MKEASSFAAKGGRLLLAVVLLSIALRLVSALFQGNSLDPLPGIYDQISYHALATRVLDGHGFSFSENWWPATKADAPTAHWSFLYTLYLVAVYWISGLNPIVARILQAVLVGILQPWLTWRLGRRLSGPQAGVAAAAISAVYGYFVYYAGGLVTESFYILAILWTLDLTTSLAEKRASGRRTELRDWILLGLAIGITVLLRQIFLLFVPILFAWLWFSAGGRWNRAPEEGYRRFLSSILVACLVVALMILPWTFRNYQAFGRFVLLNTNAGFAFFWGNHPIHGTRFIPILDGDSPTYLSLIPRQYRDLDEASMERALLAEGLGFVRQDPLRYLLLSASRVQEYFKFWPTSDSGFAANTVRVMSLGLFGPLMLLGMVVASVPRWQRKSSVGPFLLSGRASSNHLLMLAFIAAYTLIHLLSWTLVRYRLPVDGILMLYGGVGMTWLAGRIPLLRVPLPKEWCRLNPPEY